MSITKSGLVALFCTLAVAVPVQPRADCTDVHIFLAKGWNEPYPGRQGMLAGAICYGIDSCGYEDILFENGEDDDYCVSVNQGGVNGLSQMKAYAESCPDSTLVLSGYSQGAHVAGNILGGAGGIFGEQQCEISSLTGLDPSTSPGSQIKAALLFGDPAHVASQPYNYLNGSDISSDNPRSGASLTALNQYSDVLRSYCDSTDPVCAAAGPGPFVVENHLNYFDRYSDDAAGWAKFIIGY